MKKTRRKKQQGLLVKVEDFPDFDGALRYFTKLTTGVVREAKRRQYHYPKPTRSARKRRGIALAKLHAKNPVVREVAIPIHQPTERRNR